MENYYATMDRKARELGAVESRRQTFRRLGSSDEFHQIHYFNDSGDEVAMFNDLGPACSALQTFDPPRAWGFDKPPIREMYREDAP